MATNFEMLQGNLKEIEFAMHEAFEKHSGTLRLRAHSEISVSFQGTWLAPLARFFGRIWRWLRRAPNPPSVEVALKTLLTTFFNHAAHVSYDIRQRRIWHHMAQLDVEWNHNLTPQELTAKKTAQSLAYRQFLKTELRGSSEASNPLYKLDFANRKKTPLNQDELRSGNHTIVNFHCAAHEFWKIFMKYDEEHEQLKQFILKSVNFDKSAALLDRSLYKALKKEALWTQFEGMLQQEVPVGLLAKLHKPDELLVNERKQLEKWIHAIDACKPPVTPKLLATVLSEAVEVIKLQGSSPVTMQEIVYWLDSKGCETVRREDLTHKEWFLGLQRGDTIECNGITLTLGSQLSSEKPVKDAYIVFELENYPDYVVKVACNRFLLQIEEKQVKKEEEHWGIRYVETIDNLSDDLGPPVSGIDSMGRCVVQEKLFHQFDHGEWVSDEYKLVQEDEERALIFANHMFCMSQWKATAQNLSLSHLMWDKEGELKTTRILKKGPSDYNEWEKYCVNACKDNSFVLRYLMNVSKLIEHPVAKYYRQAVEYTLETGETNLLGIALPLGHREDTYTQRVKELCLEAQNMRANCLMYIEEYLWKRKAYSYKEREKMQKSIGEKLAELYRESSIAGIILPHIQEEVIASFTTDANNQPTKTEPQEDAFNAEEYYEQQYELMIAKNLACLEEEADNE